jgi:hypothetical protein
VRLFRRRLATALDQVDLKAIRATERIASHEVNLAKARADLATHADQIRRLTERLGVVEGFQAGLQVVRADAGRHAVAADVPVRDMIMRGRELAEEEGAPDGSVSG